MATVISLGLELLVIILSFFFYVLSQFFRDCLKVLRLNEVEDYKFLWF